MSKPRSRASTRDDTTTVSTGSKSKADAASAAEASDSSDDDEEEEPDVLVDVFKLDSYQERPRMNLPTQEVSVPPGQPRKVEAPIDPKGFKDWNKLETTVSETGTVKHEKDHKTVVRPPLVPRSLAEEELLHSQHKLTKDAKLQHWLGLAGNYDTVEKDATHFLPHVGKQTSDSSPAAINNMLILKERADVHNSHVWANRRDFSMHEHGHLPTDDELIETMNEEQAAEWQCSSHQVDFPDTWTDPVTGDVMWREERMDYLRSSQHFRTTWDSAWEVFAKKHRRSHIERLALHIYKMQLCSFDEALCALVDCDSDEHEAIRRLRNFQYRCEMALVAEIMGSRVFRPYFSAPRINAAWKEKLQKKDELMERLKTPPGGWSRNMQMKLEAPTAVHTPGGTPANAKPAEMIEGEFDPPPGVYVEGMGAAADEAAEVGTNSEGGGSRVSLPNLKVDTRKGSGDGPPASLTPDSGGGRGGGNKKKASEEEPLSPD